MYKGKSEFDKTIKDYVKTNKKDFDPNEWDY